MNLMSVAGEYGLVWCMMNEEYYADSAAGDYSVGCKR
jgi:hypothetical protein